MSAAADLTNAALEVAEDYPVFPCNAKKEPLTTHGFHDATQDLDKIERLFAQPAAALIGVPTGKPSGLVVIDVDTKEGKRGDIWYEANKGKLDRPRVQKTQSGGWHRRPKM